MIISNKENPLGSISLSYAEWLKDYIKTGRYINYVVNDPRGVVELHKADDKTHKFTFNMLVDESTGKSYAKREPIRFKIEPISGRYSDEHLIVRKVPFERHPNRLINLWIRIPSIKNIKQRIVTSTTSKVLGNFIFWVLVTVVGGLIVLIVWSIFEGEIVSLFNR